MIKETRKEQKEKTREHLRQTAFIEFATKGIQSTKTLDIAKAAGVAHGTIFAHYPTREDLLMEVVKDFGMRIGQRFLERLNEHSTMRDVLKIHLEVIQEFESFYTQLITEMNSLPKEVRTYLILIQSGIAHHLEKAIKGAFTPFILNTWIGLIHYYLMNRDLFAPGHSVIELKGEELLNNFIHLINQGNKS